MESKRFYWLKLKRDFFKRHDIRVIESMPNGKEYVLFYLKLLIESIDHEGRLRFNDTIPYNEQMLSVITDTNIDIVKSALKLLEQLNLIEVLDDNTLYMSEVEKMVGSETDWAEKKRLYRGQCPQNVLAMSDKSIEKDIDIDKDKEKDKELDKELDKDIDNPPISPKKVLTKTEIMFDEWWGLYPKHIDKKKSFVAFKNVKHLEKEFPKMIEVLKEQKQSKDWQKQDGQFIPYPVTYLHGERWNDEIVKEKTIFDTVTIEDLKAGGWI